METQETKCTCCVCNIPDLDTIRLDNTCFGDKQQASLPQGMMDQILLEGTLDNLTIRIKDNAVIDKPLQIVNIICSLNQRKENHITLSLGENARATMIYCDDSLPKGEREARHDFSVKLAPYSQLYFYKLENVNNFTTIESKMRFDLEEASELSTYFLTLNGGKLSNDVEVNFLKDNAMADLNGLYLMDKQQSVDTKILIRHKTNTCRSTQLFKGILDDEARADFLGRIIVDYNAVGNIAMQTNNNILLTDKAKVSTQPILEIYNDDVQCSHGATTGQLDENALYYLKSRGISSRKAKMLLLSAFCQNVLEKCNISQLREGLSQMIETRLNGGISL